MRLRTIAILIAPCVALTIICVAISNPVFAGPATERVERPISEKILQIVDSVLFEPGYGQARELARVWQNYISQISTDEHRMSLLENLANSRPILSYLKDPTGPLAAAFEAESSEILTNFGNATLTAWRLRSLDGKIYLAHNEKLLAKLDTSVARREINAHFFTLPISGAGFNYSLDAAWDVTTLPDYPLSHINSEYMFIQTDAAHKVTGLASSDQLPNNFYKFASGEKFLIDPYGIQQGFRFYEIANADQHLIICYPFAGYAFYIIRAALVILLLLALILLITKIQTVRNISTHVLENRSGQWLNEHYQQSLNLNDRAMHLADKSVDVITAIKSREQEVIGELGKHLQLMQEKLSAELERVQLSSQVSVTNQKSLPGSASSATGIVRPLHKKLIHKAAIHIETTSLPAVEVSIDLDLPLKDEQSRTPVEKAGYLNSLKRRASEKKGTRDFIHDELLDNYDYVAPAPMPMPVQKLAADANEAELDYVQKFRYSSKAKVLPMAATNSNPQTLKMREDLVRQALIVSDDD